MTTASPISADTEWAVGKQHKVTAAWWHVTNAASEAEARFIARDLNRISRDGWVHRPYRPWRAGA